MITTQNGTVGGTYEGQMIVVWIESDDNNVMRDVGIIKCTQDQKDSFLIAANDELTSKKNLESWVLANR